MPSLCSPALKRSWNSITDSFREPSWDEVQARRAEFADWPADDRLVLDSMSPREGNLRIALARLGRTR